MSLATDQFLFALNGNGYPEVTKYYKVQIFLEGKFDKKNSVNLNFNMNLDKRQNNWDVLLNVCGLLRKLEN